MKKKTDKPLMVLLAIGIVGGAVLYNRLSAEIFCLTAAFWLLVCYLWQNDHEVSPWYEKLGAAVVEAVLWSLTAVGWFILGYGLSWLMGWHSPWIICLIEGAFLHLIGWQFYDLGLAKRWWFNLKQYLYYVIMFLGLSSIFILTIKNILN